MYTIFAKKIRLEITFETDSFFIDTRNKYYYSNCSDYFDHSAAEQVAAAADFADTAEGYIEDYRADYTDNYKADSDINHLRSVESYR